jgi:hypothetical protein
MIQDYRPLEIDVSDNSPNDETRDLIGSLVIPQGMTLRYWRNTPSLGPIENHQKLFAAARGSRIIWMNDDDVLLPGAVRAMADAFLLAPDVILSYGIEHIINPSGESSPEITARWNAEYCQLPEYSGLHRDLLVRAFWQQIPHVGFMVLTDAARKVGIRDRSEVGLAVDADFSIRLGQMFRGSAYVFLDRVTVHSRLAASTLSKTSQDVCWQLHDIIASLEGLSPAEASARDRLLRRIGPLALREHSLAHRRRAALRILTSMTYRQRSGFLMMLYSIGLISVPKLALAVRGLFRNSHNQENWLPKVPAHHAAVRDTMRRVTANPAVPEHS